VQQWQLMNADLKTDAMPDANDEYLLYQSLLANYTMPTGNGDAVVVPDPTDDNFAERFDSYIQKALHEAKRHVSEVHNPGDDAYVKATKVFGQGLLDRDRPFWLRFETFLKRVANFGITNSLVQVVLKNTCPGVPDLYQGAESWDLSFVDPDNRRPVDFAKRRAWLADFGSALPTKHGGLDLTDLWNDRFSGRVKLFITHKLLQLRQSNPDLFAQGDYLPLMVEGIFSEHIMAFARHHGSDWLAVVMPLFPARLCHEQGVADVQQINWQDTRVVMPEREPGQWTSVMTGGEIHEALIQELFRVLPVAVLV